MNPFQISGGKSGAAWRPARAPGFQELRSPLFNPWEQTQMFPGKRRRRRPLTFRRAIADLPGVKQVVQTWHPDPHTGTVDFGHAAWSVPPFGLGAHVTDDPERVADILARGRDIRKSYGYSYTELGGGGLFLSAAPQMWTGRARRKWEFLDQLGPEQREILGRALLDVLANQRKPPAYISAGEFDIAVRDLSRFVEHGKDHEYAVLRLADQPYNIRSWEPSFLTDLGLPFGPQPVFVETVFFGSFAEVRGAIDPGLNRILRRNVSGAFMRSSWGQDAQLLIWDRDCIVKYGYWINPNYAATLDIHYQKPGWARGYLYGAP